jgi:hypothetical protein
MPARARQPGARHVQQRTIHAQAGRQAAPHARWWSFIIITVITVVIITTINTVRQSS